MQIAFHQSSIWLRYPIDILNTIKYQAIFIANNIYELHQSISVQQDTD